MLSTSTRRLNQQIGFLAARKTAENDIKNLPEIVQGLKFVNQLKTSDFDSFSVAGGRQPRPITDLSSQISAAQFGSTRSEQVKNLSLIVDSAFATFTLHIESRVANLLGKGFYTIGPCGEELIAPIGLALRPSDPLALHYRHLAPSILRRLSAATSLTTSSSQEILQDILFDRARGYTVSSTDPVCGGHHCCLGGNENDFLVTSTLASQCNPALGRALGIPLARKLLTTRTFEDSAEEYKKFVDQLRAEGKATNDNVFKTSGRKVVKRKQEFGDANILGDKHAPPFASDAVSFVSLGDGSLNNAHFLTAINMADYALNRQTKAPVVFCITDNGISISLRGHDFVDRFLEGGAARFQSHVAHGSDMVDSWIATHKAVESARKTGRPQILVLNDITRRFGHAATDRQAAYMSRSEIQAWQDRNPLLGFAKVLVEAEVFTPQQLSDRFLSIWESTKQAFERADKEPKITSRKQVAAVNSAPLLDLSAKFTKPLRNAFARNASGFVAGDSKDEESSSSSSSNDAVIFEGQPGFRGADTHVMRKHMNKVFDDIMTEQQDVVYMGEDVTHGGYYLVTEGLQKKFPARVIDFPPDETSLVGIALGFSQAGLTPILEIPYAKYLDCGFDMFTEVCVMHWLSQGKEANGMVIRLQGYGRGVFGGNYHTHNMLHIPPGLDVVCCSRGDDYSKLMQYSIQQARAGRVVMFVDCTELLNLRDVRDDGGCCWEFPYSPKGEVYTFDDVTVYRSTTSGVAVAAAGDCADKSSSAGQVKRVAIVTYGNGLIASLEANVAHNKKILEQSNTAALEVDVVDCRLLSAVPRGLKQLLMVDDKTKAYDAILFADPSKFGTHPLSMHYQWFANWAANADSPAACNLPVNKMKSIGADFTYNPLGNKLTFLNASDIVESLLPLLNNAAKN